MTATEDNVTTEDTILQERLDIVPYVVGGAVGSLVVTIILALVLVLTVTLLIRKYKSESRSIEARIAMAQNFNTAYIKMKANDSYIPISRQISTKDNIAYGELDNSGGYEQVLVAYKEKNEEDNTEYDYINE